MANVTREALAQALTDNRVLLLNVKLDNIKNTTDYLRGILTPLNWNKVGGEGNNQGMRGLYSQVIDNIDNVNVQAGNLVEIARVAINAQLQNEQRNRPNEPVAAHVVISQALQYDNTFLNLLICLLLNIIMSSFADFYKKNFLIFHNILCRSSEVTGIINRTVSSSSFYDRFFYT